MKEDQDPAEEPSFLPLYLMEHNEEARERLKCLVENAKISDRNLARAYAILHSPDDVEGFLEKLARANDILNRAGGFVKVGNDECQTYGRLQENPIRIIYEDDRLRDGETALEVGTDRLRAIITIHFEKGHSFTSFILEGSSFWQYHQIGPGSDNYDIQIPVTDIEFTEDGGDLTVIHLSTPEGEYRIKTGYENPPDVRRAKLVNIEEGRKKETQKLIKSQE
ncbi:MAG: hypothetical protein KAT43_04245 [Nanoarchaeota archaeon]|nr:hypothetical protein [Nanoarchaeota archaeon]